MGLLIIYDGDCGFCDRFIRFVASRDKYDTFRFMSNTCTVAKELLQEHSIDPGIVAETIVVIEDHQNYVKGAAILRIFKNLPGFRLYYVLLRGMNHSLLDVGYALFSRVRRRIIKQNACSLPSLELRRKFIC